MIHWFLRYVDGTRIKFSFDYPPFRPTAWKLISTLTVDFVYIHESRMRPKKHAKICTCLSIEDDCEQLRRGGD